MKKKIWDLLPDGGGDPVLVQMEGVDAREAIERHPERYTDKPPEGTVEHQMAERQRARNEELAEIQRAETEALAEIHAYKQARLDKLAAEQREAKTAEAERVEAERREENSKLPLPNRQGEIGQIEAEAAAARAKIKHEHDEKRAELRKQPLAPAAVEGEQS